MARYQKTLEKKFSYTGIGLHTGKEVTITCRPQPEDTGVKFKRLDLAGQPEVAARVENVVSTQRCTSIGKDDWQINTIEHLMSALAACQIDNLLIELDSNEPPITDGSSKVFYQLLTEAGIKEQSAKKEVYQLKEPIYLRDGDQYLTCAPADSLRISYTFVSNHPGLEDQFAEFDWASGDYSKEIAPARTFGFAEEIKKLKKAGLALGGSLDNAILIEADGPVNDLRFKDEIVRHKILDIVGDLKLIPEFTGHIMGVRSGHKLNSILAEKLQRKIDSNK